MYMCTYVCMYTHVYKYDDAINSIDTILRKTIPIFVSFSFISALFSIIIFLRR